LARREDDESWLIEAAAVGTHGERVHQTCDGKGVVGWSKKAGNIEGQRGQRRKKFDLFLVVLFLVLVLLLCIFAFGWFIVLLACLLFYYLPLGNY